MNPANFVLFCLCLSRGETRPRCDCFVSAGVKFRRQHWLFLLICLLVFVIILSIYLPIATRVDDIEVNTTLNISTLLSWTDRRSQVS